MNRWMRNYLCGQFGKSVFIHWWLVNGVYYCILGRNFDLIFLSVTVVDDKIEYTVDKIVANGYNKNAVESGKVEPLEWTA